MDEVISQLLERDAKPLEDGDLPVFPKHWPKDELAVTAAHMLMTIRDALRDIIDADSVVEVGGIQWTGQCGTIAQNVLKSLK